MNSHRHPTEMIVPLCEVFLFETGPSIFTLSCLKQNCRKSDEVLEPCEAILNEEAALETVDEEAR